MKPCVQRAKAGSHRLRRFHRYKNAKRTHSGLRSLCCLLFNGFWVKIAGIRPDPTFEMFLPNEAMRPARQFEVLGSKLNIFRNYETKPTPWEREKVGRGESEKSTKRTHCSAHGSKFRVQGSSLPKLRNEPIPRLCMGGSFEMGP